MIETLTDFPDNVVAVRCHGRVTKPDYDRVIVPAVTKALNEHPKVRLYYETAADFTGIDADAVWEDFMIGMEHLTRWERMAVITDVEWIKNTMKFFSFLMPGQLRLFALAEAAQAKDWVVT